MLKITVESNVPVPVHKRSNSEVLEAFGKLTVTGSIFVECPEGLSDLTAFKHRLTISLRNKFRGKGIILARIDGRGVRIWRLK